MSAQTEGSERWAVSGKQSAVSGKHSAAAGSADILSAACVARNLEAGKMPALPAVAECLLLTAHCPLPTAHRPLPSVCALIGSPLQSAICWKGKVMLKQLSRLERTRSIIIVGFAVLMAVSLIVFYAPGRNSSNLDPAKNTSVVASVNGEEITVADVARLRDNYMQMFGGRISMAQLGGYKRFVDGLVRDRVVAQEAARLGLGASDQEVAQILKGRGLTIARRTVAKYREELGILPSHQRRLAPKRGR